MPLYLVLFLMLLVVLASCALIAGMLWLLAILMPSAHPLQDRTPPGFSQPLADYPLDPYLRAEQLFMNSLTEKERREWERYQRITIQGSDGCKYVLKNNCAYYNVTPKGKDYSLCAHVPGVPIYDDYLVQKLILETNAQSFLREACRRGA